MGRLINWIVETTTDEPCIARKLAKELNARAGVTYSSIKRQPYCTKCGHDMEWNDKYCRFCGSKSLE